MSLNLKTYVDDNETIYVSDYKQFDDFGGGDDFNLTWGLAEIDKLEGQSTVFINRLDFKLHSWLEPDETSSSQPACVQSVCGIAPIDYFNSDENPTNKLRFVSDYQDVKGWPLKNCFGWSTYARENPRVSGTDWQGVLSSCSWSRSYRPRKALLINRLQAVVFNIYQDFGTAGDLKGWMSVTAQLKRGD